MCFWPWSHQWTKWADKSWSQIARDVPLWATSSSTAKEPAIIGTECTQERRCTVCNRLELRSVVTRL